MQKSGDTVVELDDSSVVLTGRYVSLTSEDQELITFICDSLTVGLLSKILQSGARRADLFLPNRDYGMYDRNGATLSDSRSSLLLKAYG